MQETDIHVCTVHIKNLTVSKCLLNISTTSGRNRKLDAINFNSKGQTIKMLHCVVCCTGAIAAIQLAIK